jgi:hypothetical protein
MVTWEGLLDALAAARKTKARAERNLPSRTGARWSEVETQELAKTFKAGGSIAQLARVHNRTQFAVEAQLERQGLWDRVERRPTARAAVGEFAVSGRERPSGPANAASRRTPAPAAGSRHDPDRQAPSGATDARQPHTAAPVADRRRDAGQQPAYGPMAAHQPPTPTPAAGGRHEIGQQLPRDAQRHPSTAAAEAPPEV